MEGEIYFTLSKRSNLTPSYNRIYTVMDFRQSFVMAFLLCVCVCVFI